MPPKNRSLSKQRHETAKKVTTKSIFGSHKSMLIKELENDMVLLKDDIGEYITFKNRLDNGLADPLRWSRMQ